MRVLKPGGLLVLVVPMNLGHLMLEAGYKAVECDPQAQKTAALSADCQVRRAPCLTRSARSGPTSRLRWRKFSGSLSEIPKQ